MERDLIDLDYMRFSSKNLLIKPLLHRVKASIKCP